MIESCAILNTFSLLTAQTRKCFLVQIPNYLYFRIKISLISYRSQISINYNQENIPQLLCFNDYDTIDVISLRNKVQFVYKSDDVIPEIVCFCHVH